MWTKEVLNKCYHFLKPKGFLITYYQKGVVKRTLKEVGFLVESLDGPPGKREMIRLLKKRVKKTLLIFIYHYNYSEKEDKNKIILYIYFLSKIDFIKSPNPL